MGYTCEVCKNKVDWNLSQELRIVFEEENVRTYSTIHLCEYCYEALEYVLGNYDEPTHVIINGIKHKLSQST